MPGGDDVPLSDRGAIIALSNEGLSQRAIGKKLGYAQSTVSSIIQIARKVWRQVSAEYLEKLYESLPRRMEAVIAAGGGHTKYWKKNIDEIVNVVWINELFLKVNEDFCSR